MWEVIYFLKTTDYAYFTNEVIDYYGLITANRYKIPQSLMQNKTNNPFNANYFSDRWNGVLNQTSINKAPLFYSKAFLMDADAELQNAVKVYQQLDKLYPMQPNIAFDIFIDVEPITGTCLGAVLLLQLNVELQKDDLFPTYNYAMLPVL